MGRERDKSLVDLLLSLNNQLSGLQEKENILLRGQALGNHCLNAGLLMFSSCCTPVHNRCPAATSERRQSMTQNCPLLYQLKAVQHGANTILIHSCMYKQHPQYIDCHSGTGV